MQVKGFERFDEGQAVMALGHCFSKTVALLGCFWDVSGMFLACSGRNLPELLWESKADELKTGSWVAKAVLLLNIGQMVIMREGRGKIWRHKMFLIKVLQTNFMIYNYYFF